MGTRETMKGFPELMLAMLQDKEAVLTQLIKDLDTTQRTARGCRRVVENWDEYSENPENIKKQLLVAIQSNSRLADINIRLVLIALVYMQGRGSEGDIVEVLNKLGMGDIAVKQLMQNKLGGPE